LIVIGGSIPGTLQLGATARLMSAPVFSFHTTEFAAEGVNCCTCGIALRPCIVAAFIEQVANYGDEHLLANGRALEGPFADFSARVTSAALSGNRFSHLVDELGEIRFWPRS
jgi:hypothetical protein